MHVVEVFLSIGMGAVRCVCGGTVRIYSYSRVGRRSYHESRGGSSTR